MNNFVCLHCSRISLNKGLHILHELRCKLNPLRVPGKRSPRAGAKKGSVPWNKNLTKETSDIIMKSCEKISKSLKGKSHPQSSDTKQKLSVIAKNRGLGGYQRGSGRGKSGWYKNIYCDSSWELAFVLYCESNNKQLVRNIQRFPYEWEGKTRMYIPDFILENELIEIKGYNSPQWQAKRKAVPNLKVMGAEEMKPILEFVYSKYGKDFIKLYGE